MSEAIEALSEYKYLLESMGHDAQSTGPYMRCLDAIASLQAMQGQHAGQGAVEHELNILHKSLDGMGVPRHENEVVLSAWGRVVRMPQPAVPEGYVPVPRAAVTEVLRISDRQHPAWDAVKAVLLSAAKGETE